MLQRDFLKSVVLGNDVTGSWLTNLGWTLVRLFVGLNMAIHGFGKVPPSDKFIGYVGEIGLPFPAFFAWSAGLAEFVGGAFLFVGLLTRPAAFFVFLTMFVAAFGAHGKDPFGEGEMALLYGVVTLGFALMGAGAWSVDALLRSFRRQKSGSSLAQSVSTGALILFFASFAVSVTAQTPGAKTKANFLGWSDDKKSSFFATPNLPAGNITNIKISPSGRFLSFIHNDDRSPNNLYVDDYARKKAKKLTERLNPALL